MHQNNNLRMLLIQTLRRDPLRLKEHTKKEKFNLFFFSPAYYNILKEKLLLGLFVRGVNLAPFTKLLKLDLFSDEFLVLA